MSISELETNPAVETQPSPGTNGEGPPPPVPPSEQPPSRRRRWLIPAALGAVIAAGGAAAAVMISSHKAAPPRLTLPQAIARATRSVVRLEGEQAGTSIGGSGVVVNGPRELVVTNAHVVEGTTGLKAQIGNDTSSTTPVHIVAVDPCDDLAVVQLVNSVPGLQAMPMGSASSLRVGDTVVALGFPGGTGESSLLGQQTTTGQTATVEAHTGTVSQADVQSASDPDLPAYQDLIEHGATINPGDSGGALINSQGQLVGIDTLSASSNQGEYYAISIDYAKRILPSLEAGRSQADLGWQLAAVSSQDPNLAQELAQFYSAEGMTGSDASSLGQSVASYLQSNNLSGMMVTGKTPGSVVDKSQLNVGDMITSINGNPVQSFADVCQNLQSANAGQTLHLAAVNVGDFSNQSQFVTQMAANGDDPTLGTDLTMPANQ